MMTKEILEEAIVSGKLSYASAKQILNSGWRGWIAQFPKDIRQEAETFFYLLEGYVEEIDEGFFEDVNNQELYARAVNMLRKVNGLNIN